MHKCLSRNRLHQRLTERLTLDRRRAAREFERAAERAKKDRDDNDNNDNDKDNNNVLSDNNIRIYNIILTP